MVKVEIKDISTVVKHMAFVIPLEETTSKEAKIIKSLAGKAKLRGFRAGRIPEDVIKGKFKKDIKQEVSEQIIRKHVEKELAERKIEPIAPPLLIELNYSLGKEMDFLIEIEIEPEFEIAGYDNLSVKAKKIKVHEEDIEKELKRLQRRAAEIHPVQDRSVQNDDICTISGEIAVIENGKKNIQMKLSRRAYTIPSNEKEISNIDKEMLGMKTGEKKEFEIILDTDRFGKEYKDKNVQFNITLDEIHHVHLPEINNEFAKSLGDFQSLKDLKKEIQQALQVNMEEKEKIGIGEEMLDLLKERNQFEIPPVYIHRETDNMLYHAAEHLLGMGVNLRHNPIDWEKMREELKPKAVQRVARMMVARNLAQQKNMAVDEEEIKSRIAEIAKMNKTNPLKMEEDMKKSGEYSQLMSELIFHKVVDFLIEINNIKIG